MLLERLPTADEAEIIRAKLRIPKRVEYSEEALAQKREQFLKARDGLTKKSASSDPEAE